MHQSNGGPVKRKTSIWSVDYIRVVYLLLDYSEKYHVSLSLNDKFVQFFNSLGSLNQSNALFVQSPNPCHNVQKLICIAGTRKDTVCSQFFSSFHLVQWDWADCGLPASWLFSLDWLMGWHLGNRLYFLRMPHNKPFRKYMKMVSHE